MNHKPKNKWGKIDKEKVKELYMLSPYLEWTKFAESQGWNPHRSRTDFSVSLWTDEKKKILSKQSAEDIKSALFNLKSTYHLKVIDTLSKYPKLTDEIFEVLSNKIKKIKNMPPDEQSKVPTKDILSLTKAISTVTEAKYKSLMLDRVRWTPDVAETDAISFTNERSQGGKDQAWKIEVIGGENLTQAQLTEYIAQWYDRPQTSPPIHKASSREE